MRNDCPCHGCPDRYVDVKTGKTCHSSDGAFCSHGYVEWVKRHQEEKDARKKSEAARSDADGCAIDSWLRTKKRTKRSWKR